jgi:hypothetical protein
MGGLNFDTEALEGAPLVGAPPSDVTRGSLEIETPLSEEEQRTTLRLIQRRLLPICWCVRAAAAVRRAPNDAALAGFLPCWPTWTEPTFRLRSCR